jgi:NADP-dependent 3-hydroxy acid dehydrogenase YdfG
MTTANISGAVIVVTGAGSGIGRASALMLAERGATVVAVDCDGEAIDKVTATTGGLAIAVDIRDPQHGDAVIARVLERYQRVDAVVANAGVGYVGDFATMPPENITTLVEVNFRGPLLLTRAALPSMTERGSGALVFTTSIAGGVPVPTEAAYCFSKSALETFADALREELRPTGSRSSRRRSPPRSSTGSRPGSRGAPFLAGSRSRSPLSGGCRVSSRSCPASSAATDRRCRRGRGSPLH